MLRSVKDLEGYAVESRDEGTIGHLHSLLFEDTDWRVEYLVVSTGAWIPGRRVLVRPMGVAGLDASERRIDLTLTREEVKRSPDLDDMPPVSRQEEAKLKAVLQPMALWEPASVSANVYLDPRTALMVEEVLGMHGTVNADPHLRSTREVEGYHVGAIDGAIGHIRDLIVDTGREWMLEYAVIDAGAFLVHRDVLVHISWMTGIDWEASRVTLDLTRKSVEGAPHFDPHSPINQESEHRLFDYYGLPPPRRTEGGAREGWA